jgi:hypothetical protein
MTTDLPGILCGMSDHQGEWGNYKKHRNQFTVVSAACLTLALAFAYLTDRVYHTYVPGYIFGVFWLMSFAFTRSRLQAFPYPRCGKRFFKTAWYGNILARRCVHCGLAKYAI